MYILEIKMDTPNPSMYNKIYFETKEKDVIKAYDNFICALKENRIQHEWHVSDLTLYSDATLKCIIDRGGKIGEAIIEETKND